MANIWRSGAELNSLTNGVETTTNNGTITTTNQRSGGYGFEFITTGTAKSVVYNFAASDQQGAFYFRVFMMIPSSAGYPSANEGILTSRNSTPLGKIRLILTTTGTLVLNNIEGPTNIGSASAPLAFDTNYCVEMKVDCTNLAAVAVEAKINGVTFASGTTTLTTGISQINFGAAGNVTSTIYMDDFGINDGTGSYDNSWLGSSRIAVLVPNAAGDANSFGTAVGGTAGASNNYTRVNEVTPNDATSYNASPTLNNEDFFLVDTSAIPANAIIKSVSVGIRVANLAGADATAAIKPEIKKTTGGTILQGSAIIPNSTAYQTNAAANPRNYPLVANNDPDGNPWTVAMLATMQIGYKITAANVRSIAVTKVWASVEYTTVIKSFNGVLAKFVKNYIDLSVNNIKSYAGVAS